MRTRANHPSGRDLPYADPAPQTPLTVFSVLLSAGGILSLRSGGYDLSHYFKPPATDVEPSASNTTPYCGQNMVFSAIAFTAGTTMLYGINRDDALQDRFLLSGLSIGTLSGMALFGNLQDALVKTMPVAVLASLVIRMGLRRLGKIKTTGEDWHCQGFCDRCSNCQQDP